MTDGYQIIEPDGLKALLGNPLHFEFAVAVLSWLIPQISAALGAHSNDITLEIIRVNYMGSYPALGVKYTNSKTPNFESRINSIVNDLLREKSASELITAISSSKRSWSEITKEIMDES